jgi:hypothetical protein
MPVTMIPTQTAVAQHHTRDAFTFEQDSCMNLAPKVFVAVARPRKLTDGMQALQAQHTARE